MTILACDQLFTWFELVAVPNLAHILSACICVEDSVVTDILYFKGCGQCAGASHSRHLQRIAGVSHLLAHLLDHGRAAVYGQILPMHRQDHSPKAQLHLRAQL